MISRTASMSQPYTLPATRNRSVRAAANCSRIVVSEEAKILQRIGSGKRNVGPRGTRECRHQLGWHERPQLHRPPRAADTPAPPAQKRACVVGAPPPPPPPPPPPYVSSPTTGCPTDDRCTRI